MYKEKDSDKDNGDGWEKECTLFWFCELEKGVWPFISLVDFFVFICDSTVKKYLILYFWVALAFLSLYIHKFHVKIPLSLEVNGFGL